MKSFFFVSKKSLMLSRNGFHKSLALGLLSSGLGFGVGYGLGMMVGFGFGYGLGMTGRPLIGIISGWLGFSSTVSSSTSADASESIKSGFGFSKGRPNPKRQFRWGGFVEHGSIAIGLDAGGESLSSPLS